MERRINEYTKRTIIDMSKKVLEHLAKKYSNVKEGVGAIMGGKILDHEAKDILNAGRAEGRAEVICKMLKKGFSIQEIADTLDESIVAIETIVKE